MPNVPQFTLDGYIEPNNICKEKSLKIFMNTFYISLSVLCRQSV